MIDLIQDNYEYWSNDTYILNGATGSGKTYFILNKLGTYCQENWRTILYLVSRKNLQIDLLRDVDELELSSTIEVTTYQSIQFKLEKGIEIEYYDYIVYDECHYFTSDGWNQKTDLIFNFFKYRVEKATNIFMSGTGYDIFKWLEQNKYVVKENNIYTIPYNYNYVDKVVFYYNDGTVEDIFNKLKGEEKCIYFSKTLDRAKELFDKYKDKANFICSKYCKYKKDNQNCIKVYNKDLITFEKQILITTCALDVGVSIKDKSIKYIITDLNNIDQLQQCLGRKRIVDATDICTFYIKNHTKKSLNGSMRTMENNILAEADEYYLDRENYIRNKNRDLSDNPCFYYEKPSSIDDIEEENSKIGNLMFNYYTYMYYQIQYGNLQVAKTNGFDKFVLSKLGDTIKNVEYVIESEKQAKQDELLEYLNSIVGKKLLKDERKELIDKIGLKDSRGRIQKSINQFNAYFQANKMPYVIESKTEWNRKLPNGEENPYRGKKYWIIYKKICS